MAKECMTRKGREEWSTKGGTWRDETAIGGFTFSKIKQICGVSDRKSFRIKSSTVIGKIVWLMKTYV
jgi:hypothetical protein